MQIRDEHHEVRKQEPLGKKGGKAAKLLRTPSTPMPKTVISSSQFSSTHSTSSPVFTPSSTLMVSSSSTSSNSIYSTTALPVIMSLSTPTSTLSASMASSAAHATPIMAETNNNSPFLLVKKNDRFNPRFETLLPEHRYTPYTPTSCIPLPRTPVSSASRTVG